MLDILNEDNCKDDKDDTLLPKAYDIAAAFAEFVAQADKQAETENNSNDIDIH